MGRHRMLATAIGVLAVAGCGGDDGPTKAEFVEQANAVCKEHRDKTSAAAAKLLAGGKLPSPQQFGRLAQETIIPEYTAQISELRPLEPPAELADDYRAWLADSEALSTRIKQNPALIQNPDSAAAVNRQARALGFSGSCDVGPA
ncbi:MAG: hypothetical protein M3417_04830 [Actinomycetota bacterium]|nr:hypothetical protein [Actinomycetota bacterium]